MSSSKPLTIRPSRAFLTVLRDQSVVLESVTMETKMFFPWPYVGSDANACSPRVTLRSRPWSRMKQSHSRANGTGFSWPR